VGVSVSVSVNATLTPMFYNRRIDHVQFIAIVLHIHGKTLIICKKITTPSLPFAILGETSLC